MAYNRVQDLFSLFNRKRERRRKKTYRNGEMQECNSNVVGYGYIELFGEEEKFAISTEMSFALFGERNNSSSNIDRYKKIECRVGKAAE